MATKLPEKKDVDRVAHMLMHTSRMLQMLAERPDRSAKSEYAETVAVNRAIWAELDADDRAAVVYAIGPQKGKSDDYLKAAIAALES